MDDRTRRQKIVLGTFPDKLVIRTSSPPPEFMVKTAWEHEPGSRSCGMALVDPSRNVKRIPCSMLDFEKHWSTVTMHAGSSTGSRNQHQSD